MFVFVADTDGDLSTHETFPTNRQIKIRATIAVRSKGGRNLASQVLGATTVGPDTIPPEVSTTPPPNSFPVTEPAFADTNVDPLTTSVVIEFTEPIQPWSVGSLPTGLAPGAQLVHLGHLRSRDQDRGRALRGLPDQRVRPHPAGS